MKKLVVLVSIIIISSTADALIISGVDPDYQYHSGGYGFYGIRLPNGMTSDLDGVAIGLM